MKSTLKLIALASLLVCFAVPAQNVFHRRAAFRGAGGGNELPAGMVAHWEADSGVYNDAGTTLATDGQTVQEWHDQIGSSDFGQTTAGDKPIFRTGQQNGLPGVEFVSSDFMTSSVVPVSSYTYTVYIVMESDGTGAVYHNGWWQGETASDSRFQAAGLAPGLTGDPAHANARYSGGNNVAESSTGFTANTATLVTAQFDSGSRTVWINGADSGTESTTISIGSPNGIATGMARDTTPDQALIGFVYEIVVDNAARNTAVESYLNTKWGL